MASEAAFADLPVFVGVHCEHEKPYKNDKISKAQRTLCSMLNHLIYIGSHVQLTEHEFGSVYVCFFELNEDFRELILFQQECRKITSSRRF
jgi:hypothetical protein